MNRIRISVNDISVLADLRDTPTATGILQLLPIDGIVRTWGNEIYFEIPLSLELEADARDKVEIGELGYWPTGSAFCVFFGPTPMSTSEKPVAASDVNVFGQIVSDCNLLKNIRSGASIIVTKEH